MREPRETVSEEEKCATQEKHDQREQNEGADAVSFLVGNQRGIVDLWQLFIVGHVGGAGLTQPFLRMLLPTVRKGGIYHQTKTRLRQNLGSMRSFLAFQTSVTTALKEGLQSVSGGQANAQQLERHRLAVNLRRLEDSFGRLWQACRRTEIGI
jgi:hypothetical protein